MRHIETGDSAARELTAQREAVLAALLTGQTITAAAGAVGVARQTVHRWLTADPAFIAAHNGGRRELANAHAVRLLTLCGQALDVVGGALEAGDVRAALAVLRGAGMFGGSAVRVDGSDDPDEVSDEQHRRMKALEFQNMIANM